MLKLQSVQIFNNGKALFPPLNMEIPPGEIASIMGPSGCGKSTLLSAISGSLAEVFQLTGDILLNGKSVVTVPMERRRIGILFQDDLLFPHMSIGENLAFALPPGENRRRKRQKIEDAMDLAGLNGFADRDPATLSGGQRARVSLFRSLLAEPRALLLDEPFSKLDMQLRGQIRRFVFETINRMNIPALLVSHDPGDCPEGRVFNLGDREV